ncbi:DUF1361 domain-containing protein [Gloeocapsopsis dulcis]|uniref:DUF1361 domain-containing protein n=1 Tax=Gloeocapsopsis dulcis AAB1 = 1H9 TaxID=1433147 RepID=A0A6N8G1D4_9CHRO|nr:DUF1361 domain-containing protein [Gloeocapsopsis dulcis]MUL39143.1 hypothetical protein [Gloeocapsopsis dulcis AAB1 = 1H9]WNN90742.1 DUF1361 domain-containing protein [Gloeocapsopsis dulcis]
MIETLFNNLLYILQAHSRWMSWNLFLAFIPLGLSVFLFRRKSLRRSLIWWLGFLIFFAFLPNAPYVLTDIIHLVAYIRRVDSIWLITLIIFPLYLLFMLLGFEAYVISLINLGSYLHRLGKTQWIFSAELMSHALCAIGVYLGRFQRFNSWDLVTQLDVVATSLIENLLGKRPIVIIAITFIVITVLYWIAKQASLGIVLRQRSFKSRQQNLNRVSQTEF